MWLQSKKLSSAIVLIAFVWQCDSSMAARKTTVRIQSYNEDKLRVACDRLHLSESALINHLIFWFAEDFWLKPMPLQPSEPVPPVPLQYQPRS